MTTTDRGSASVSSQERAALYRQVRAELRAEHNRLTERQIDLIAAVAVDLRVVRLALGVDAASAAATTYASSLDLAPPPPSPASPDFPFDPE